MGPLDSRVRRAQSTARESRPRRDTFIAWDGEGFTNRTGAHRYVLLANSLGETWHRDGASLSTLAIFDALLSVAEREPRAIHVMYGAGYDVNMWLGDLPRQKLRRLWRKHTVTWYGFKVHWLPRHQFSLSDFDGTRRITLWDVLGYFQRPFVDACEMMNVLDQAEADAMRRMKSRRDIFTREQWDQVVRYCVDECRALDTMMQRTRERLLFVGLDSSRWDGAGSVAAQCLKRNGVRERIGSLPPNVKAAAEYAYFGGRIELLSYGHTDETVYEYDINSAYPYAMTFLPCLTCGQWIERDPYELVARVESGENVTALWRVTMTGRAATDDLLRFDPLDRSQGDMRHEPRAWPFPFRDATGRVLYPSAGTTVVWTPEIETALAWSRLVGAAAFRLSWATEYVTTCAHRPFQWVPELYAERQRLKSDKNGAEYVLKLGLNASYGKLAQRTTTHGIPPYRSTVWAGLITSITRATLFRAALPALGDVIQLATDALYTTVPLDLADSNELGGWKAETHAGGTFVQPGVYWLGGEKVKTRGFGKTDVDEAAVIRAWREAKPNVQFPSRRFIGLGSVVNAGTIAHRWRDWRRWLDEPRELTVSPLGAKRDAVKLSDTPLGAPRRAASALIDTRPYVQPATLTSTPSLTGHDSPEAKDRTNDDVSFDLDTG